MDNLTTIVRDEISRQYRSVRQFAFAVGVPLSTINSALHNGVGGSSFDTVMQICKLDDYGRHTVASVMQVEYERCSKLNNLDD